MKAFVSALLLATLSATGADEEPGKAVAGTMRIKFQAYDGDVRTPAKMEFQINPLDAGGRTEFVKIGDTITGTFLKVVEFVFKEAKDPATGQMNDVSELKVMAPTGEVFVLPLNKTTRVRAPKK